MLTYIIAWIAAAVAFLGLDAVWLSNMSSRVYKPVMGEMMRPSPDLGAAGAFYVIYVSAIVFFAVAPGLEKASLSKALINGALLGFVAYATYDLTNQSTLKFWELRLTLVDMAWGTFATAAAAGIAYAVSSRFS
ncbi:MAG: DUF2177 family protein [Caulobacteraceae bacterium]|nr:DUF2177 family protein [Caulobacteraceae bacterium]